MTNVIDFDQAILALARELIREENPGIHEDAITSRMLFSAMLRVKDAASGTVKLGSCGDGSNPDYIYSVAALQEELGIELTDEECPDEAEIKELDAMFDTKRHVTEKNEMLEKLLNS